MFTKKTQFYIWSAVALHLLAAIFSIGFFNHDEQREVLQLVGHKLGNYDGSYLSFQYHSAMRSWLHPALYLWTSKLLLFFGPFNPFTHAFFYRLISGFFGLLSLWMLYLTFKDELQEKFQEELFFLFSAFLWFMPFLHVRTSNENVGASFFIFALYFLKRSEKKSDACLAGLLFALTFALRFQLAFMMVPTALWFLFIKRYPIKNIFIMGLSFFALFFGIFLLDSSLYGHWTFTPYNYFYINIIQKYAASFGVTPWYDYFYQAYKRGGHLLGILFTLCFIFFWIRFPKHLLTWTTLGFVIAHLFIGHKELRFLFPIIFFLPVILTLVVTSLNWEKKLIWKKIFLAINVPLVIYYSLVPCSNLMKYYKHLYESEKPISKIYVAHPFEDFTKFYLKNDVQYPLFQVHDEEIKKIILSEKDTYFFAMNVSERDLILQNEVCQSDFTLFPKWIYDLSFVKKLRTFRSWTLIHCQKKNQ